MQMGGGRMCLFAREPLYVRHFPQMKRDKKVNTFRFILVMSCVHEALCVRHCVYVELEAGVEQLSGLI